MEGEFIDGETRTGVPAIDNDAALQTLNDQICELHEPQNYAKTCCARHFVLKNVEFNIFKDETCRRTLPAACHESPESRIIAGEQAIRRPSP